MDIVQDMRNAIDREIEKTLFASFGGSETERREINPIKEVQKMMDKMANVVLCNPEQKERLEKEAEKAEGFWKVIGVPYVDKGQAVVVNDEKLKLSFISAERNRGKL